MASVVPQIQTAVYDALKAAAAAAEEGDALHGVEIVFGAPTGHVADEHVAVGAGNEDEPFGEESRREAVTFPITNPTSMREDFTLRLVVDCLGPGGTDPKKAYGRTAEVADAVEDVLGRDVTFAGLIQHGLTVRRRATAYITDQRRGFRVFFDFSGVARRGVTST